ncbi:MAG: DUF4301 family protein [Bacteroidales bacterium]|nr:DUF4301 family protein [Bacteroidales bacterium]
MFNESDIQQLQRRNIPIDAANQQIERILSGFKAPKLFKPALAKAGVLILGEAEIQSNAKYYDKYKGNLKIAKFVPASGAASRMFKEVNDFLLNNKASESIDKLIDGLEKLPFYENLEKIFEREGKDIRQLKKDQACKEILNRIIDSKGLSLGNKPKAMIPFHKYGGIVKTAFEEQINVAVKYAVQADKQVNLHFTLSPEHIEMGESLAAELKPHYEKKFDVKVNITFSIQSPATDTLAIDKEEEIVRTSDNQLLLRPGGHGALLENLNAVTADIIFIQNIDNVSYEKEPDINTLYKKALAGILLNYQKKITNFLHKLNRQRIKNDAFLMEVTYFLKNKLCFIPPDSYNALEPDDKLEYLIKILNRPSRVCGMVRNTGEPGGGPFWVTNDDGSCSLQIIEASQVDTSDLEQKNILESSSHFNPVDIVCYLQDMNGRKFDLCKHRNPETGIITSKTYDGKEIKILEHPGLWNGGMWEWNTIFVEVPLETFSPVKTVNDLLRPAHQPV